MNFFKLRNSTERGGQDDHSPGAYQSSPFRGYLSRLRKYFNRPDSVLRFKKDKSREGLTLVDMALAVMVAAVMTISVTNTVATGMRMQKEADRLTVAVALAQLKMSQLLSNPFLKNDKKSGQFPKRAGIYAGYKWEWEVKEDEIDLAEVARTGELTGAAPVDDKLPTGVQNLAEDKSLGSGGATTQTGGKINIVRIIVVINYPKGRGKMGVYRVETFRGQKKTS